MGFVVGYLLIFSARVVDVSLATVRTLMVVQGRKMPAALIGFFEVGIYVTVLGKLVSSFEDPLNLLSYCLGFACGNYVGIIIENKVALGSLGSQIVLKITDNKELIEILRQKGFGVTVMVGQGLEGTKDILNVVLNRKDLNNLKEIVYKFDKNAFIIVNSISPINGGYFSTNKK